MCVCVMILECLVCVNVLVHSSDCRYSECVCVCVCVCVCDLCVSV